MTAADRIAARQALEDAVTELESAGEGIDALRDNTLVRLILPTCCECCCT